MEGDFNNPAFGYGGSASSTNPFFSNFASPAAAAAVAANPNNLVTMRDNGGYYTYNNYTGPDGNGAPVYGETPWVGFNSAGQQTSAGVMQKAKFNDLALMAALSAFGMGMFLPGMIGGAGAAGGAAGAGAGAAGAAGSAGGVGGAVSTGMGSYLPLGGTAGAGTSAASTAGGGLFSSGVGNTLSSLGSSFVGGAGGGTGGGMWGQLASAGLNYLGSQQTAKAAQNAANTSAQSQTEAARIAADAARFRPVGITTRFGGSGFQFDGNGNLVGAGYSLSPDIESLRERTLWQANQAMGTAEGMGQHANRLFGLGSEYLAANPQEVAQNWMTKQQSLLAPSRERALAGVRNGLFNTGRTGLSVGATGERPDGSAGLGAANPEMEAYYNSLAQQDAQLAAQADQFGRDQVTFGQGLFSGGLGLMTDAYNPMKTTLGLASTLESLGSGSMDMGAQLGGRAAQAGGNVGQSLFSGLSNAARTLQGVNSYSPTGGFLTGMASNPQLMSGLGNWASSIWGNNSAPHITQTPSSWTLG